MYTIVNCTIFKHYYCTPCIFEIFKTARIASYVICKINDMEGLEEMSPQIQDDIKVLINKYKHEEIPSKLNSSTPSRPNKCLSMDHSGPIPINRTKIHTNKSSLSYLTVIYTSSDTL